MDNASLNKVLQSGPKTQFWLKPIGRADSSVLDPVVYLSEQVEVRFTRGAGEIAVGDLLIAYRPGLSTLLYVAVRIPSHEWTSATSVCSPEAQERYPYYFLAKNLTPSFVTLWQNHRIKPFTLARQYNPAHPGDEARLGRLQHASDRAPIPRWFAEVLIRRIQTLP